MSARTKLCILVVTFRIRHSQAKCILVAPVCVCVCVCLSLTACLHYSTYSGVTYMVPWVLLPKRAPRSVQPFSQGSRSRPTDRKTDKKDRARYNYSNKPQWATSYAMHIAMRPNNSVQLICGIAKTGDHKQKKKPAGGNQEAVVGCPRGGVPLSRVTLNVLH